jgi:hypothetical protein
MSLLEWTGRAVQLRNPAAILVTYQLATERGMKYNSPVAKRKRYAAENIARERQETSPGCAKKKRCADKGSRRSMQGRRLGSAEKIACSI